MPIIIALLVLGALVVGAVYAFDFVAARLGEPAAIGISIVVALVVIALVARWIQRRREIAPNTKEGDWTHALVQTWGGIRVSATKGLLWLSVDGAEGEYTLTDLHDCAATDMDGRWYLIVKVRDKVRAEWKLPMSNKRDADRWTRILTLAQAQKL
ncbi:signal peptide protein [Trinickia sp. YCB016]